MSTAVRLLDALGTVTPIHEIVDLGHRAGHHCAQPILRRFGHEATVRASLAFYNTCAEVDAMAAVLHRLSASSVRRPVSGSVIRS